MRHRRSFSYSSIYFASIQRNNITGEVECTSQQEAATSRSTLHLQNKRQSPDHHCLSTAAQNPSSRDLFSPYLLCLPIQCPRRQTWSKTPSPKITTTLRRLTHKIRCRPRCHRLPHRTPSISGRYSLNGLISRPQVIGHHDYYGQVMRIRLRTQRNIKHSVKLSTSTLVCDPTI